MQQKFTRNIERLWLLAVSIIMVVLFYTLYSVLKRDFEEVPQRLVNGSMINLTDENAGQRLNQLLTRGFYFEDPKDIRLISTVVAQRLTTGDIDNIGELNKSKYNVNADEAYATGGESFKKRVETSRRLLGFSGDDSLRFQQERTHPPQLPSDTKVGLGEHSIKGIIRAKDGNKAAGVLVRLQMLVPQDSAYSNAVDEVTGQRIEGNSAVRRLYATDSLHHQQLVSLIAYARTNASGEFSFSGLPEHKAFQVLPLQPGYQFGASKGIQELEDDVVFNFTQSPHTIRLLATKDFNDLKKEGSLIVRTPEEVSRWYSIIVFSFFGVFLLLHIFLTLRFAKADQFILPVIMVLTGLSLLTLFSLQDPLRDRFLARSTLWYFTAGAAGMVLLLLFNMQRFTNDSGLYRMFRFKEKWGARGMPWAGLAALLLLLTILFGAGPEGSGVKVNLFGLQPSEMVKFLIVVFLAGFFTANEKFISGYATLEKRWSYFSLALGAILLTILLFLMLGDLGPAIVVCFAFIILFSFSRGDFGYMVFAVMLFVLAN